MRLAPNTSSDAFLEAFVDTCEAAGLPEDLVAQQYHILRIKEACVQSDDFRDGLEKVAFGGIFSKGIEATARGLYGVGKGLFSRKKGMIPSIGSAFKGMKWLPEKKIFGKKFGAPTGARTVISRIDPSGKVSSKTVDKLVRGNPLSSFLGRSTAEAGVLGGGLLGLNVATGNNPLEAINLPNITNPFRASTENIKVPEWMQGPDGGIGLNPNSGAFVTALGLRKQVSGIDKEIQRLNAMISSVPAGTLEGRMKTRQLKQQLDSLNKTRRDLTRDLTKSYGEWSGSTSSFKSDLDTTENRLKQNLLDQQGKAQALERYLAGTEGNPYASLWHKIPGVNPYGRANRILNEQQRLAAELERIKQMREAWGRSTEGLGI